MAIKTVTDYLNRTAEKYPDKPAFVDEKRTLTFREVRDEAKKVAMTLIERDLFKRPIAVFLEKQAECIPAFMGAAYSGNFYTPLDTKMPEARVRKIIAALMPAAVITDAAHKAAAESFAGDSEILIYEEMMKSRVDEEALQAVRERMVDTDILYVLFTSGSTGEPKGAALSHRAVISYVEWGAEEFGFGEETIFGNQTPFYFIMSGFDIYQTLRNGCTMYIIPKMLFSFPIKLLEYMKERRINTVCWVPSVLCLIVRFKALEALHLEELRMVIFGGEVMPSSQLNMWRREYPDVQFIQTYGQTETSETCVYYRVDRELDDEEPVPIGGPCSPMDVLVLGEDEKEVQKSQTGELCVRGPFLASGYYNDSERTKEAFMQNPLNESYPEVIYRTGDLVRYNERGELIYVSRKDFQIKHMGHRIELGEIEAAASLVEGIDAGCCVYDKKRGRIILFYEGSAADADICKKLREALPDYMLPHKRKRLDRMPFNPNGKIDRKKLEEML